MFEVSQVKLAPSVDLSRARFTPFAHQIVGVRALVVNPYLALFDDMGAGKTKQVIDASQLLFHEGKLQTVVVVCPTAVRSVWFDDTFGELVTHLWEDTPADVIEYHSNVRRWRVLPDADRRMYWIITNYEYIRTGDNWKELSKRLGERTLLVLDESSAVKTHTSKQAKACWKLRKRSERVVILNGTPVTQGLGDLYSQGNMLHPSILECSSWTEFRARYAVMGGYLQKEVVKWVNVEDVQRRFAPYVLRRLKEDCLDLPDKLPPVTLTVPLSSASWKVYVDLREEMLAWLDTQAIVQTKQAGVRALRLAQICSGFLGGVEEADWEVDGAAGLEPPPDWLLSISPVAGATNEAGPSPSYRLPSGTPEGTREVGREKLDLFLKWYADRLALEPNFKIIVWCRFRPELARMVAEIKQRYPEVAVGEIRGGQTRSERDAGLRLLDPKSTPPGPVLVAGTPGAGSMGINLTAAHVAFYFSNDYNLKTRLQSLDRIHRPGQVFKVSYFDIVATGPKGQKTVDTGILRALYRKEDLSIWTTSAWRALLSEQ